MRTELYTKVTFITICDKAQVYKFGQIMQSTKENGEKIKQTVVGNSGMLTETYMKVNGKMIKQMAMELQ